MYEKDLNKINPTYFSKNCSTTGLFAFLVKDVLEYCGLINNEKRSQIKKIFNNNVYFLDNLNIKINKIENQIEYIRSKIEK